MTEPLSFNRILAVLKRQWWIVVAVVAVAGVAGFVASSGVADVYTGVAKIAIDTAPSSRYRGMPVADDLVKATSGSEMRAAVAQALGTSEADVAANLRATAAGNPLTTIRVTYTAATKDAAQAGARAGANAIIDVVDASMAKEIAIREAQIEASKKALAAIDAAARSEAPSAQTAYQRWAIETQLLDYTSALEGIVGVYTYDGTSSSSVSLGSDARNRNVLGAAVVGVALGILLAGVREALRKRT
ncbi:MAG: hypothetical protein D9V44_03630 [Actinobacteria bacterium]|nr:MAG: hypothetical protein D9V44_03630 [Actinomycetota bacterium]